MDCSEFRRLLDGYVDGELDERERGALEAHAAACASCGAQLKAARQLRDMLGHINDGLSVPLPAQAAWRSAVRAQARRQRMKRVYAACGAVAAACVLTVGVTAMLRGNPAVPPEAFEGRAAYVEADGIDGVELPAGETALLAADSEALSYVDRVVLTDDIATAQGYLMDIVAEYGATVEHTAESAEDTRVYVRVSGENAADFLRAVDAIGLESDEAAGTDGGEAPALDESAQAVGVCVILTAA